MTSPSDLDPTRPGSGDAAWNHAQRDETETQRLDRNWNSLLQELRVVQTGVQILTGFLLTLPFHDGFEELGGTVVGAGDGPTGFSGDGVQAVTASQVGE